MERAVVNKIIPFSSVDGPGNRTAVFLQGCGFTCKYCHNPETIHSCIHCGICVDFCHTGAIRMEEGRVVYEPSKCVLCDECIHHCPNLSSPRTLVMTTEEVMDRILRNVPFIRGITVSGGECTTWRGFLVELLGEAKKKGLNTLLDSNGSFLFKEDPELMAVTDGVMLDVKAWDLKEHRELTGQENGTVKKNLEFLVSCGKLEEVRTVVVPDLIDAEETVREVSKVLMDHGRSDIRYKLIKYRVNGVREPYRDTVAPTDGYLRTLKALAEEEGLKNVVLT